MRHKEGTIVPTIEGVRQDVIANFEFLQLGKFMSHYIRHNDLSAQAENVRIILFKKRIEKSLIDRGAQAVCVP